MRSVIGRMPLAIILLLAGPALACAPEQDESVGQEKCVAFQRDTVPQGLRTAQFIDDHIELVPASEEVYLERESAVVALGRDSGTRFLFLARRPSYPAWRLRNSLRDLVKALKSIDETSPGQDVDGQRAKSAAFAIVSLAQTRVDFAEYVRMDNCAPRPFWTTRRAESRRSRSPRWRPRLHGSLAATWMYSAAQSSKLASGSGNQPALGFLPNAEFITKTPQNPRTHLHWDATAA